MAAPHVFVDTLDDPVLGPDDRHHLERVLRVREGDAITACDGHGGVMPAALGARGAVVASGPSRHEPRPQPELTVGFALVKNERPEWIVQKLTEAGIDRIVPFVAARTIVRWDAAKAAGHVARWRRVAREAAMQSRRAWLPVVDDVRTFAELASAPNVALAAPEGGPPTPAVTTLLIGPEGGWAPEELAAVDRKVRLGTTILRAETAAVGAGVLLCALRSGTVAPAEHGG